MMLNIDVTQEVSGTEIQKKKSFIGCKEVYLSNVHLLAKTKQNKKIKTNEQTKQNKVTSCLIWINLEKDYFFRTIFPPHLLISFA